MFTLNAPRSISYMISIDYPDDDEIAPGVEVILDATELPKREVEKLFKIAEPLGFSREDEDEPYATLEIARLDQRDVPRIGGAGWDTARVARAILELHSFLGSPAKKI